VYEEVVWEGVRHPAAACTGERRVW